MYPVDPVKLIFDSCKLYGANLKEVTDFQKDLGTTLCRSVAASATKIFQLFFKDKVHSAVLKLELPPAASAANQAAQNFARISHRRLDGPFLCGANWAAQ